MQYKYTGTVAVSVPGVGIVEPGEMVKTQIEINHPLFVEHHETRNIDEQSQTEKQSKSKKTGKSVQK